ncbi:unnamed protein product [Amoebophrya sp. A120]|nr:unnamed protein product [Amoebophrya sp. A120]|eukprot:GSA120T00021263001.1
MMFYIRNSSCSIMKGLKCDHFLGPVISPCMIIYDEKKNELLDAWVWKSKYKSSSVCWWSPATQPSAKSR